jgi:hypothetical protein
MLWVLLHCGVPFHVSCYKAGGCVGLGCLCDAHKHNTVVPLLLPSALSLIYYTLPLRRLPSGMTAWCVHAMLCLPSRISQGTSDVGSGRVRAGCPFFAHAPRVVLDSVPCCSAPTCWFDPLIPQQGSTTVWVLGSGFRVNPKPMTHVWGLRARV